MKSKSNIQSSILSVLIHWRFIIISVCVGPLPPSKTTTTVPTSTPTAGTCVAGSAGLGKGDGYKGYCCKDQADCVDDCVKG